VKVKITVIEGDPHKSITVWGSDSGSTGGMADKGAEFIAEGEAFSAFGNDPVPGATDEGKG
jgi:hypothetical protein